MRKPRITQAMIARAFARKGPIHTVQVVRQQRGDKSNKPAQFIKYTRGQVVFKKMHGGMVLALYIPSGVLVYRAHSFDWTSMRKCRTRQVYTLGRVYGDQIRAIRSTYTGPYHNVVLYSAGQWSEADGFSQRYRECARGLHFFETLAEARRL